MVIIMNLTNVNFYKHKPLEMQILTQEDILLKCIQNTSICIWKSHHI